MAKVQTRRTISISREAHEKALEWSQSKGQSLSSLIEEFIRRETGMASREYHARNGKLIAKAVERVREAPTPAAAAVPSPAQIEARLAVLEARAFDNPCRAERCSIRGLHEAHP